MCKNLFEISPWHWIITNQCCILYFIGYALQGRLSPQVIGATYHFPPFNGTILRKIKFPPKFPAKDLPEPSSPIFWLEHLLQGLHGVDVSGAEIGVQWRSDRVRSPKKGGRAAERR